MTDLTPEDHDVYLIFEGPFFFFERKFTEI